MIEVELGFRAATRRLACAGLLALAAAGAMAQAELPACPPGEEAALRAYVPTAAKLKALTDAYESLAATLAKDPALAALLDKDDDSGMCRTGPVTQPSFAGMQQTFSKVPQMGSIFGKQGITARELVIWSQLSVLMGMAIGPDPAAAAKDPTPPAIQAAMRTAARDQLSPAQQAFARDSSAGLRRLLQVQQAAEKAGQR
jgi:hypothetical protein